MARAAKKVSAAVAAERRTKLGERTVRHGSVTVTVLPPAERVALRAPAATVAALSKALGVTLPQKPKESASEGGRHALWLGPDEWMIIDEAGGDPLADLGEVKALHSAVDISHRNVGLVVTGAGAEAALSAGCPQDLALAAFPVCACSRTLMGKVEIVLLRTAEDAFRVECWRSFADYVFDFLDEAAQDAAN
jgi:sarcosine oxidase, subunit gamma